MKRFRDMNRYAKLALLGGGLALAAGPAAALDVYLAAKPFTKGLPVSGGGTQAVPMWGYVEDTGDGTNTRCYDIAGTGAAAFQARLDCVNALPPATIPGPRVTLDPTDTAGLRIFLTNGLPEPTSIVIPGQELPFSSDAGGPTWNDGSTGPRPGPEARVRSYGVDAAASGGKAQYFWNVARNNPLSRSGTFIYHSGTWPQKQVYMGLYGALTKDAAAGEAYLGVPYDNEVVLFYSDVDPAHNYAIDDGSYTTSIHYQAQWFLVDGEPYVDGMADIPAGSAGETTLVRFLSAASETHVPTLQGLYMSIHAEDGFRYTWQNGDTFGGFAPREQYTAMLPPLKTMDATITVPAVTPPATGRYAVYDGNGFMTNPSDPNNFAQSDEIGGMLRFLSANQLPVITPPVPDPLTVTAPLCATSYPAADAPIAAWLASATASDPEDGSLPVSNDAPTDFQFGDTLVTFSATDTAGAVGTGTATVQLSETPNTAPTVNAPVALTIELPNGTTSVLATDSAIALWLASATASDTEDATAPTVGNDAPGSFPAALSPGTTTTVTFTATDGCGLTTTATSTVTVVEAGNTAPVVTAATPDPLPVTAPLCATSVLATNTAIVDWLASASANDVEDGPLTPTNDAPGAFLIGDTLVTFTATDSASAVGTATATVQVAATPNAAPTVTAPAALTIDVPNGTTSVSATEPAIADWLALASATDAEDATDPTVGNDAPVSFSSGTTTTVTFTATDGCGLTTTATSTVTVVEAGNTAPVVTAATPDPLPVTAPLCATSVLATNTAIVDWLASASANDVEDGPLTPTNDAPGAFLIGDTLVTFTATDSASAVGTATATVQVAATPNTAPTVTAPLALTINVVNGTTSVSATDPAIAAWLATATATDTEDAPAAPTFVNDATSFPATLSPGTTTTVTFTATDGCGLTTTATSTVTVVEASPVNVAPVAADDIYGVTAGTTLTVAAPGVLGNDTDTDGPNALTAALVSATANGNLVLGSNGAFAYTPSVGFTGQDTFTYVAQDGAETSNVATVTINVTDVVLYLSLTNTTGTLVGRGQGGADLAYTDDDILSWNGQFYEKVLDGALAGLKGDLYAFAVEPDRILLALNSARWLGGSRYEPQDVIAYDRTNGGFSMFFDGSDVGLLPDNNNARLDAIDRLPDGRLVLSTRGFVTAGGIGIPDEDLIAFSGTFGANTSGTFARYFDGTDVALAASSEDVDAAAVAANGDIYLSTWGAFNVGTLAGQDHDVFTCNGTLTAAGGDGGITTSCESFSLFIDGALIGLGGENIDAIDLP